MFSRLNILVAGVVFVLSAVAYVYTKGVNDANSALQIEMGKEASKRNETSDENVENFGRMSRRDKCAAIVDDKRVSDAICN
jgi:hypothetical protein